MLIKGSFVRRLALILRSWDKIILQSWYSCCQLIWGCAGPREHQMLHAISPISVKICLLKQTKWFLFGYFRGMMDALALMPQRNRFKIRKCMKLSPQWYLTDYSERLYAYRYILNECTTQTSVKFDWQLLITNKLLFFLTFWFIQIFYNFWVKYLPLPEIEYVNVNNCSWVCWRLS